MPVDANIIKQNCLKKWCGEFELDKRLNFFNDSFEKWFCQLPEATQSVAMVLIQNLEYYSRQTTNKWLLILHKKLIESSNVTDENTVYAFIKSRDGKSNSSNDYWTEYKAINEVNSEICYERLDAISLEQWNFVQNIVFIDDFSGSGKSFIDELKKAPLRYVKKNVYFISINIMTTAVEEIRKYADSTNTNIVPIFAVKQEKAFDRLLFDDADDAKSKICQMSNEFKIPRSEHLGYKDTQSLVAFYNNTPNNTLGFIRYDTDKYKSLFPRKNDKKPFWQTMNNNSKNRKIANYNNAVKNGE